MTNQEWRRLLGYWHAKQNAPYTNNVGRKHTKGRAKHVGAILKNSHVVPGVGIERVFVARP